MKEAREHVRSLIAWLGNYRKCRDCDGKPTWREGPIEHEADCGLEETVAAARAWLAATATPGPSKEEP